MTLRPVKFKTDIRQRDLEAYFRVRKPLETPDTLVIEDNRITVQAALTSGLCQAETGFPEDVNDWTPADVLYYATQIRTRLTELLSVPGE